MSEKDSKAFEMSDDDLNTVSGGAGNSKFFPYKVLRDDTLDSIAMKFGTSVAIIKMLNPIITGDTVKENWILVIPRTTA